MTTDNIAAPDPQVDFWVTVAYRTVVVSLIGFLAGVFSTFNSNWMTVVDMVTYLATPGIGLTVLSFIIAQLRGKKIHELQGGCLYIAMGTCSFGGLLGFCIAQILVTM